MDPVTLMFLSNLMKNQIHFSTYLRVLHTIMGGSVPMQRYRPVHFCLHNLLCLDKTLCHNIRVLDPSPKGKSIYSYVNGPLTVFIADNSVHEWKVIEILSPRTSDYGGPSVLLHRSQKAKHIIMHRGIEQVDTVSSMTIVL